METIAGLLPEDIALAAAGLLMVASFFTSALTAAFGVGGGVAMLALLGLFVPVAALIPVHGAVQLGSNTGRAWHQRAHVRRDIAAPFLIGSLAGAAAGALVVVQLPDFVLKLLLGAFIIAVKALVATHAAGMTVQHFLKVLAFAIAGFAFAQWLPLVAAMIASGYLGTVYGSVWLERLPEETFRRWFKVGITLLALDMIRRGLLALV